MVSVNTALRRRGQSKGCKRLDEATMIQGSPLLRVEMFHFSFPGTTRSNRPVASGAYLALMRGTSSEGEGNGCNCTHTQ
jgi:hypothetical protein